MNRTAEPRRRCTRRIRLLVGVALAASFLGLAPRALAEPPASGEASSTDLKRRGNSAMADLKYLEALEAYRRAFAISPDPTLRYNMGRALQALGRYPEALDELEAFSRDAPPEVKARVPTLDALVADVAAHVATVDLECEVHGAHIVVRNELAGDTHALHTLFRTNAGPASIDVTADGYLPYHADLVLAGSQETTAVKAVLAKKATSGVLRIATTPEGASVWLDGQQLGRAPAEASVRAGAHTVEARQAGMEDVKTSVVVAAGELKDVGLRLETTPPLTARWWFWTAVGGTVVLVAGVVLTAALVTERGADTGTISPGRASTPLVRF